ncbi:hypothetical protein BE61_26800 [Bradyrhizobium elkanii USDA 61]|nr:hypothetical protein BE61_26800 [Bradyrhizobium elkanii USDA 61]
MRPRAVCFFAFFAIPAFLSMRANSGYYRTNLMGNRMSRRILTRSVTIAPAYFFSDATSYLRGRSLWNG